MQAVFKKGYCRDATWPYHTTKFATKPASSAFSEGDKKRLTTGAYFRVQQSLTGLKAALAGENPIAFGFSVYDSFMSAAVAKNGKVPMPRSREGVQGGHAMLIVGYDDETQTFIVRNSWGTKWGSKGYCYMPYEFVASPQYSSDFWTVIDTP